MLHKMLVCVFKNLLVSLRKKESVAVCAVTIAASGIVDTSNPSMCLHHFTLVGFLCFKMKKFVVQLCGLYCC